MASRYALVAAGSQGIKVRKAGKRYRDIVVMLKLREPCAGCGGHSVHLVHSRGVARPGKLRDLATWIQEVRALCDTCT